MKKAISFILSFLILCNPLFAAGARVQGKIDVTHNDSTQVTSVTLTFDSNVTAGNAIYASVGWGLNDGTPSAADGALGNTYTAYGKIWDATNNQGQAQFYAANINGGACTITYSLPTSNFITEWQMEISGIATGSPQDGNTLAVDASSEYDSGNISTTKTDFLLGGYQDIASANPVGTISSAQGFTLNSADQPGTGALAMEYKVSVAAGSVQSGVTSTLTADRSIMAIMALIEAGGTAPKRASGWMRR